MNNKRTDVAAINAQLEEQKLNYRFLDDLGWLVYFEQPNSQPVAVMMILPPAEGAYLYMIATLGGIPALEAPISDCSAETLRRLILLQSDGSLARIAYTTFKNGKHNFSVTSECSAHEPTGDKLRRRLEAVAHLTAKLRHDFGYEP